jgi:hypothetical protein
MGVREAALATVLEMVKVELQHPGQILYRTPLLEDLQDTKR